MTVKDLSKLPGLRAAVLAEPDREIHGGYAGDLLSWVMGRAGADSAWATIMTNINVVAVASLADVSCVVICEGCALDEAAVKAAEDKSVNIIYADMPVYTFCGMLSKLTDE